MHDFKAAILKKDFFKFSSKNTKRMCIHCRKIHKQAELFRLCVKDGELSAFDGSHRSFYICQGCISCDKLKNSLLRILKTKTLTIGNQALLKHLKGEDNA